MATTDLRLEDPGSLIRPGPLGRLTRLGFAVLCLYYVTGLLEVSSNLLNPDGNIRSFVWNGIVPTLLLVSYVINIGFSRQWKKWPAAISGGLLLIMGIFGFLTTGTLESELFARAIWLLELYMFAHLGLAFLFAAVLRTPGCEMRAFHDLYSKLTGEDTKEHICPIGPLRFIDSWEANLHSGSD